MDFSWSSEPPLLSHNRRLSSNYTEQNDLASQSQAGFLDIIRTEESSNSPGPSLLPPQSYTSYHGSKYQSIPLSVPNLPNRRPQFYESEGPSLTCNQFTDLSAPTHPNNADTLHAASTQYSNPTGWTNRQMEQTEIANNNPLSSHQDIYRAFRASALPESPYTMDAGTSPLLSAESYAEYGGATLNLVATQGQNATAQEALQREQKILEKRERDKAKKKIDRDKMQNTLANRILDVVEGLVERQDLEDDLRVSLETEAVPPSGLRLRWIHTLEGPLELLEAAFLSKFGGSF
ncbi:hypothetical protein BJV77DRAFT_1045863 [Russula vinacea]|nr:hypothetical protein BJV77DRAFT_1045863 [Russula vinacea]